MAKVNICDVTVLDNPSPFKNPFQFEITFECLEDLKDGEYPKIYILSTALQKIKRSRSTSRVPHRALSEEREWVHTIRPSAGSSSGVSKIGCKKEGKKNWAKSSVRLKLYLSGSMFHTTLRQVTSKLQSSECDPIALSLPFHIF